GYWRESAAGTPLAPHRSARDTPAWPGSLPGASAGQHPRRRVCFANPRPNGAEPASTDSRDSAPATGYPLSARQASRHLWIRRCKGKNEARRENIAFRSSILPQIDWRQQELRPLFRKLRGPQEPWQPAGRSGKLRYLYRRMDVKLPSSTESWQAFDGRHAETLNHQALARGE